MHRLAHATLLAALALSLGCGSSAAGGPSIPAFAATEGWTPSLRLDLTVESAADLSSIHYAWVRPDGSVIGREALLLGAALGDDLAGRRTVTATRLVGTGSFVPPTRVRLRAVDVEGRTAQVYASVVHPAFGDAGATCDGAALACAGELACTAASCAVPGAATAVCQASAAPAWSGDLADLPVPAGDASAVAGTCWPLDAAGAVAHRIVVEAAAGEHLEVALPPGATAMLRVDCAAPASEMICLDASGGLDLEAGAYELLVAGSARASAGAVIRLTRTAL